MIKAKLWLEELPYRKRAANTFTSRKWELKQECGSIPSKYQES